MMTKKKDELGAIKQALDHDWPEIQKHLHAEARKQHNYQVDEQGHEFYIDSRGQKVLVAGLEYWLQRFDRKDVIFNLPGIAIMNTADWHVDSAVYSLRAAYGVRRGEGCGDCFSNEDIRKHIERFPEGQFAAIRISGPSAGNTVGMAVTMRTSRPPTAPILPWRAAIGDMQLSAHEPEGDWLYGVEMAVRPMYQRKGIGTGLYEARMRLVGLRNLRGWYMVGMLMGYEKHADAMDVADYGAKVIAREIKDPTVTMQMNRGFRPLRLITDYVDESAAGHAGVLLVWDNPHFDSDLAR